MIKRMVTYLIETDEAHDEPEDWRELVASGEAETYADELWYEGENV